MMFTTTATHKKSKKRKWLFVGLGLAATSALSFFGFQYWKKHRKQADTNSTSDLPPMTTPTKPKNSVNGKSKTAPGKTTNNAKKQVPKINAPDLAKKIRSALKTKNLNTVIGLLKSIKIVSDYSAVSKEFGKTLLNGVHQTLVNGVLSSFKDEKQKSAVRAAFSAMGLKYDGKKWSLSGINKTLLITKQQTKVWKDPKTSVEVPMNMVLGAEVARRGNFSMFQNENQLFLVESQHVTNYTK